METIKITGTLLGGSGRKLEYTLALPPLGQGGNAVVCRAHCDDGTGGSEYNTVIKILKPTVRGMRTFEDDTHIWLEPDGFEDEHLPSSDDILAHRKEFMISEARMMHELQLEGVSMHISAVFSYKNTLAVAMPCVGGRTLAEEAFSGMQDTNAVLSVVNDIQSIAEKIALLHRRGKLHMDISPDNLFRRTDNSIVLLDFGSVCNANEPLTLYSIKEGFSAPEVCGRRGDRFGFEADIYSVGAVLYYLMFGEIFDPCSPGAYFFRQVDDLPVNEGSRQYLRGLLSDTLRLTPSRRMNDIHTLIASLKELRELLAGFGVSPLQLLSRTKNCYDGFCRHNQPVSELLHSKYYVPFSLLSEKLDFCKITATGNRQKNLLICGGNGSGKTTFMLGLWGEFLRRRIETGSGFIPLYVSLSDYPEDADWRQGDTQDSFILRQICMNCYGAANLAGCPPDLLSGLAAEFAKEIDAPQYVLLADGLDEVKPEVRGLLHYELRTFSEKSNLRVIVTSRCQDMALGAFDLIETDGLSDEALLRFLSEHGFSRGECGKAEANRTLMRLIRYPMYLAMLCRLHDSGQRVTDITRTGRLLHRYFLMGKESERIDRISGRRSDGENEKLLLLYRYFLPFIAFGMEKRRLYSIDFDSFEEWTEQAFCSFGRREFLKHNRDLCEGIDLLYPSQGNELQKMKSVNRIILAVCSEQCLMTEQNESLRFVNQIMRTFFAALHIVNTLTSAIQNKNADALLSVFSLQWRAEVVVMAGDILCEYADRLPRLTEQALDLLRGRFGEPYATVTKNIILLRLAEVGNLDRCDLSRLDLTECELEGISCEHAVFDESRLTDEVLLGLTDNLYTSAVSPESGLIALFSGHGEMILADTQKASYRKILLDSECDLVIAARFAGGQLMTVGRRCGYLSLCVEVYDANDAHYTLLRRFGVNASHYNPLISYQHVLAAFSPDGAWLAIANSPVYDKADGEVLLISTATGEKKSIMAEKGAKQIAFGQSRLYLINADNRLFSASLGDGFFVEDNRFEQVLDVKLSDNHEHFMVMQKDGVFCTDGTAWQKLCLSVDKRMRKTAEFRFADFPELACVCRLQAQNQYTPEMSIVSYFEDIPPRTVYATVLSLISPRYALVTRREEEYGKAVNCIGIYDIFQENWLVRVRKHRGMNSGMLSGNHLIMKRDAEATVCHIESGEMCRVSLPDEKSRLWISSDGKRMMTERTVDHALELNYSDTGGSRSVTFTRDRFESGKKLSMSVLCVTNDLRKLLVQTVSKSEKQLYVVSDNGEITKKLALSESETGELQGQWISERQIVLLSRSKQNGQKKDMLQMICPDKGTTLFVLDVSAYRLPAASLILSCHDNRVCLISFEQRESDVAWEYGNAVVAVFQVKENMLQYAQVRRFPCCCTNSPRVDCAYMDASSLIVKRRYTDQDFYAIDLLTGEQRHIYLDSFRLDGSSFRAISGLSEACQSILAKAGCRFS